MKIPLDGYFSAVSKINMKLAIHIQKLKLFPAAEVKDIFIDYIFICRDFFCGNQRIEKLLLKINILWSFWNPSNPLSLTKEFFKARQH